jgi:hypothetical protein
MSIAATCRNHVLSAEIRFRRTLFVDATPRRPFQWDVSAAPLQWDGMAHGIHGLGGRR